MKIMNRISLRMRITLLSGAILLICSAILTLGAYYNAHTQFNEVKLSTGTLTAVPIPSGQLDIYKSGTSAAVPTTIVPALTTASRKFDTTNLLILIIVSVIGMCLVYVVAGSSLRPIHKLSTMISSISEENLKQRIPEDNRKDEVGALGDTFNNMLDRLEKSFLRQKRFSANVAHELKTPLATINAGIQVLHLDKTPSISEYEEVLATTERNINRLIAVVDDLMSLYDENEKLEIVPINFPNMFESILCELHPVLEDKHIKTEQKYDILEACGNPVLIYRACFNLVENAVKYNKDSGTIRIVTKVNEKSGQIIISDSGNGIPADELEQIFEPFYRVDKSRSRKEGGAGLGLSIVKTIIEKHGWEIAVNSTLEQGTVFTITFI